MADKPGRDLPRHRALTRDPASCSLPKGYRLISTPTGHRVTAHPHQSDAPPPPYEYGQRGGVWTPPDCAWLHLAAVIGPQVILAAGILLYAWLRQ